LLDENNVAIMAELLRGFPTDERGKEERDYGLHNTNANKLRERKESQSRGIATNVEEQQ
jgi:hypothetical protein